MAKTIIDYVDSFSIACRKSTREGAKVFVDYVQDIASAQRINVAEAFEAAVYNIAYIYGEAVYCAHPGEQLEQKYPAETSAIAIAYSHFNV